MSNDKEVEKGTSNSNEEEEDPRDAILDSIRHLSDSEARKFAEKLKAHISGESLLSGDPLDDTIQDLRHEDSSEEKEDSSDCPPELKKVFDSIAMSISQQTKGLEEMTQQSKLAQQSRGFQVSRPKLFVGCSEEKASAASFLREYEVYIEMVHPSHDDSDKSRMFPSCLGGRASRWYHNSDINMRKHWPTLKKEFLKRFISNKHANLKNTYRFRVQGPNETVAQYSDEMEALLEQCDLDMAAKVDYYIRGLKSHISPFLYAKDPKTLHAAEKYAMEVELLRPDSSPGSALEEVKSLKAEMASLCAQIKSERLAIFEATAPAQNQGHKQNFRGRGRGNGQSRGRGRGSHPRQDYHNQNYGQPYYNHGYQNQGYGPPSQQGFRGGYQNVVDHQYVQPPPQYYQQPGPYNSAQNQQYQRPAAGPSGPPPAARTPATPEGQSAQPQGN